MENSEAQLLSALDELMVDTYKYKPVNVAELQQATRDLAERHETLMQKDLPPEMKHSGAIMGIEDICERFFLRTDDVIKVKVCSKDLMASEHDPNLTVLPPELVVEGRVSFSVFGATPSTSEGGLPTEDKPTDLLLFVRGAAIVAGESSQLTAIIPVSSIMELSALDRTDALAKQGE